MEYSPDIFTREEYDLTTAERHDACQLLTDILDGMLTSPGNDDLVSMTKQSDGFFQIKRGFRLADRSDADWGLPAVEKTICVTYTDDKTGLAHEERYEIFTMATVQSSMAVDTPMMTRYVIRYFGKSRSTAIATIDAPDFTSTSLESASARHMTPYDQTQLFDELMFFDAFLDTTTGNEST